MAPSRPPTLLVILFLVVLFACGTPQVAAFGAGNIPSFAFVEGKAFRHGDIEDTLEKLLKSGGGAAGGFALGSLLGKGSKFRGLDIKRVYFGNWLRDYSQAVDVAALKKLPLQTIMNLCMVLGFLAHGYATNEFEVTEERLAVYLPTEHIDNPKGYGDGEDARKYHPQLRGPVDPMELEVDPRTGMKNYIANENGHWDTSKALVRRTLEKCIHLGRQHRAHGRKQDEYEAYRLLGQLLHTLEDFPAHSNFCELALVSLGHDQVFVHVGDHVRIKAPNGKWVAPLVTGTFGGNDFLHSLLGEASDHINQSSISDLNKELSKARSKGTGGTDGSSVLRDLFLSLPGGSGNEMCRDMEGIEKIRAGPESGGKRPEDMDPREQHAVLWQILSFRDSVVKKIEKTIEKIPGLGPLIEKLMDSIAVFIYTTLEPYLKPLLQTTSSALTSSSAEVINSYDQFKVFDDPQASDPTHSYLSKDHFNLILNEPAGHLAKIIVTHTVQLVVRAWDDSSVNVHHMSEEILSCLFHPDFHDTRHQVQREMIHYMHNWLTSQGHKQYEILRSLTKDAVRNHRNVREGFGSGGQTHVEGVGHQAGVQMQSNIQGYLNHIPGVQQVSAVFGSGGGRREADSGPYTGNDSYQAMPPASGPPPPVAVGEAAQYYGAGAGAPHGGGPQQHHHQPTTHHGSHGNVPPFPSEGYSSAPATQAPQFPTPSLGQDSGYAPSYMTGYGAPPGPAPSMPVPGGGPSFPATPQYGGPSPQYGGPPPQYGGQPSHHGGPPPSQYGEPPSQYGGPPSQYGGPPSQYGGPPSQYGGPPSQYGGPPSQYGGPPSQYGGPPSQYGGQPSQYPYPSHSGGYPPPENNQYRNGGSGQGW